MTIKLAVVSGNRLFCEGVRKLVEGDPDIAIVDEPDSDAGFQNLVHRSDVVLIDQPALFATPRRALTEGGLRAKFIMVASRNEPASIDGELDRADLKRRDGGDSFCRSGRRAVEKGGKGGCLRGPLAGPPDDQEYPYPGHVGEKGRDETGIGDSGAYHERILQQGDRP